MGELWFVTGGARSGKSRFAERLAAGAGHPVVYLATMQPGDAELTRRVERHSAHRPAEWRTVEEPLRLAHALAAQPREATVIVDCLSLWVSNRLLDALGEGEPGVDAVELLEAELTREVERVLHAARTREGLTVTVTNEVGASVVPEWPLGRAYRDLLGSVNQRVAAAAGSAWLLVAGRALPLPPPDLEG